MGIAAAGGIEHKQKHRVELSEMRIYIIREFHTLLMYESSLNKVFMGQYPLWPRG